VNKSSIFHLKRLAIAALLLTVVVVGQNVQASTMAASKTKRATTTTKPKAFIRFVWMCDLMTRLDMNVIPPYTSIDLLNPFQLTGDTSDWRTEDLKAAAKSSGGACQAMYSGERRWVQSVTITQVYKKTDDFFGRAPTWNPNFKWVKTPIEGVALPAWSRKNGRYRAKNGIEMAPGCQVGISGPRGVFYVGWQNFESQETDAANVDCAISQEVLRRTITALDAGGYKYLN
jgi:hypothetical protein